MSHQVEQAAGGAAEIDPEECRTLAARCGLPLPLAAVLIRRGVRSQEQADLFLSPNLNQLPPPAAMLGMEQAVTLLAAAVREARPILVYGDYDADGLTAAAMLTDFLRRCRHPAVRCFIPHRLDDGYGLHERHLVALGREMQAEWGRPPLLLTVDCGISDLAPVAAAKELGFTVIITDHHRPGPTLPAADAILDPCRPGCPFGEHELAGVGVAFYLITGLRRALAEQGFWAAGQLPNLKEYLDLVAIGTLADMVKLQGVNRILVRAGLEVLGAQARRPGLAALAAVAGITGRPWRAEDIAMLIAPRLNAAGRLASPAIALNLLLAENPTEAAKLAGELESINLQRKELNESIYQSVRQRALATLADEPRHCLIFADPAWHPGVVGIAATRLLKELRQPVIIMGMDNGIARGSGRSGDGIDLLEAVMECQDLLLEWGGHGAALGLTIRAENLAQFGSRLEMALERQTGKAAGAAKGDEAPAADWIFADQRIEARLPEFYHRLEPFGAGNPEPLFRVRGRLSRPKVVGNSHLRFAWRQEEVAWDGIAFGLGSLSARATLEEMEMLFSFRRNFFRGEEKWQLHALDLRPADV